MYMHVTAFLHKAKCMQQLQKSHLSEWRCRDAPCHHLWKQEVPQHRDMR